MKKLLRETEIDNVEDDEENEYEPAKAAIKFDRSNNKKLTKFFIGFEIGKAVFSVMCILAGVLFIIFDNSVAIHIGSITYKENSLADISLNIGSALCIIGTFLLYVSTKYLKIGD